MTSESSTSKKGRGYAKGTKQWATGVKLDVKFNAFFQPMGLQGTKLKSQLGLIIRNPHRVPLTYLDWDCLPEDIQKAIWEEIQV